MAEVHKMVRRAIQNSFYLSDLIKPTSMKKIFYVFACTFAILSACSDNKKEAKTGDAEPTVKTEDSPKATQLEGSWEIIRATGDMSGMNVGTIYEFKGDKLNLKSPGFTNPGTTQVTDNTFSFQADGNELKFLYDYKMEGDTLVVSMQKSNQTFYMAKK